MSARFEVVHSDAEQPWHARYVASNGRIVWTTENYTRKRGAVNAIAAFVDSFLGHWLEIDGSQVTEIGNSWTKERRRALEVRYIDEREATT